VALGHWTRHHRTAGTPHGTTAGILPYLSALGVLDLAGAVAVHDVVVAPSFALRPPFVPPRA